MVEFPQIDSGLAVPVFKQEDDPIDAINKMMSFFSTVISPHFLTTNSQLRNSSNPRQQATIHDGRVTVQPVQGRLSSFVAGICNMSPNGVFGNAVYGSDSEGFGENPLRIKVEVFRFWKWMICRLDMVLELSKFVAMVVVCAGSMVVKWW
nr:hypothetical protein [Tanacetum cinerariifolium]